MNSKMGIGPAAQLRITRRGRVVLVLLAVLVFGGMAVLAPGLLSAATADSPAAPSAVEIRTIGPGESLWVVASSLTEPGADVRDSLEEIVELNEIVSLDVQVGQQVLVPAQ